ncbi:hypothetical protein ACH4FE_33360 [Streptomyces celluloflavus]|uniref:hypothetical protein n=1 Tax=Streptomyces celluloflavus TaxID=58344 RepID=UPI00379EAA4D
MPTFTVLAVMAAATATGCMTVATPPAVEATPRPAPPAPSVEPLGPAARSPGGDRATAAPPPSPGHDHSDPGSSRPDGGGQHRRSGAPGGHPAPAGHGHRDPGPAHHHGPLRIPRIGGLPAGPSGTDVCALGRAYGHWRQGSAQQRLCGAFYDD